MCKHIIISTDDILQTCKVADGEVVQVCLGALDIVKLWRRLRFCNLAYFQACRVSCSISYFFSLFLQSISLAHLKIHTHTWLICQLPAIAAESHSEPYVCVRAQQSHESRARTRKRFCAVCTVFISINCRICKLCSQ